MQSHWSKQQFLIYFFCKSTFFLLACYLDSTKDYFRDSYILELQALTTSKQQLVKRRWWSQVVQLAHRYQVLSRSERFEFYRDRLCRTSPGRYSCVSSWKKRNLHCIRFALPLECHEWSAVACLCLLCEGSAQSATSVISVKIVVAPMAASRGMLSFASIPKAGISRLWSLCCNREIEPSAPDLTTACAQHAVPLTRFIWEWEKLKRLILSAVTFNVTP